MATAKYESCMIFSAAKSEEEVAALKDKFKALIEANGTVNDVDDWGKRRLAYPINDEPEGYYVITTFECSPEFPAELERVSGITEGVLRILIVKK